MYIHIHIYRERQIETSRQRDSLSGPLDQDVGQGPYLDLRAPTGQSLTLLFNLNN